MANSLASLSGRATIEAQQQKTPEGQPEDTRIWKYRANPDASDGVEAQLFDHEDNVPDGEGWTDRGAAIAEAHGEKKPQPAKAMPMTRAQRRHQPAPDLE